jgi:hypothetical protein
MGMCPVRVGTNVPSIWGFSSNIFFEQFKSENSLQKGMIIESFLLASVEWWKVLSYLFIHIWVSNCPSTLIDYL